MTAKQTRALATLTDRQAAYEEAQTATEKAMKARDRAIVSAFRAGASPTSIAEAGGVVRQYVYRVAERAGVKRS